MYSVLGIQILKGKKDVSKTYYKVFLGELIEDGKGAGYKVRDLFLPYKPDLEVGDTVEISYGIDYDSKPFIKGFKKV